MNTPFRRRRSGMPSSPRKKRKKKRRKLPKVDQVLEERKRLNELMII